MSFLGELRSALGMNNPENTYHSSQSQSAPRQSIWQEDAQNYADIKSLDDVDSFKQFYMDTNYSGGYIPVTIGYKDGKIASARFGDGDTVWGRSGLADLFSRNLTADENSYMLYENPTPFRRNGSYHYIGEDGKYHEYKERSRNSQTRVSSGYPGAGGNDKGQVVPSIFFGYGFDDLEPHFGA